MDRRHLWLRSPRQQAILRVRHEVIDAVRDFFDARGFILADTPIFTPAACEGTTTLFPVQYFEHETAYLTQSGQLYNEANAMALGESTASGRRSAPRSPRPAATSPSSGWSSPRWPTPRSTTTWSWPRAVVDVVGRVLERRAARAEGARARHVEARERQPPFPRISYDEAGEIIRRKGLPFEWGGDFGAPDETVLSKSSTGR